MSNFPYAIDAEIMEIKGRLEKARLMQKLDYRVEDANLVKRLNERMDYLLNLKQILREYDNTNIS